MGKLDGKIAVVIAGSSGMALASAKLFVEEGAYVFITGRDQKRLDDAVKVIGKNVTAVKGDAANLADLDALYKVVKEQKGKIDVLFASAGTAEFVTFGQVTEESFDKQFDLNAKGTFFAVQKALPLLVDGGAVILNGSIAGSKGFPNGSAYAGTKAAVRAFARGWVSDLKDRQIRVNVLSPGPINTPAMSEVPEEMKAQMKTLVPRGSMGTSEEIATVALFLASSDSAFVNGIELFVDGGLAQI